MLILHDDNYYESRKPQPDLGPVKNFKRFIWNPENKSVLDRTCKSWIRLTVFYLVFFGVIFSLFFLQMWITITYISSVNAPHTFIPTYRRELFRLWNYRIPQFPMFTYGSHEHGQLLAPKNDTNK
ncbi:sodium/potassium-transporting ATPase subunit beta-2-like [Neodiprion lecontei]|uniref:Sodium/potassium-transporting ATPase subunit beta-2-like n=1 Tax=Neodiprion lecontei TaxID=441921 RepID=A0ABM3GB56_NEOLC|nr:sodium/potassium-transporting ATPase subunit beta-2-like [Neodiprion lecontei]